jgi:hypothetical protein
MRRNTGERRTRKTIPHENNQANPECGTAAR